jgi:hypothetical protein
MTVTMTFCDKCGAVIPEGAPVEKMVLDAHEYDLCTVCHTELTGDLQSKGRPVADSVPQISLPSILGGQWTPGGLPYVPAVPYISPYPGSGSSAGWSGSGYVPTITYGPNMVGAGGTGGTASGTMLTNAISNAVATISQAIQVSNATKFPSKD